MKYKVPAKPNYDEMAMPATGKRKVKQRQPTVYIPCDPDMVAKMKVGEKMKFTLDGEVVGLHLSDDEYGKESEIRLAVDTVEYADNADVEEMMDEDD